MIAVFAANEKLIAPIEREDIMELAQVTDDLTDSIEDVMIKTANAEGFPFCVFSSRDPAVYPL